MDGNIAYRIFVAHQQEKWDIWHVFSEFEVIENTHTHIYICMMPPVGIRSVEQHDLSVLLDWTRRPCYKRYLNFSLQALRETLLHLKKTKEVSWHVPSLRGSQHM